MSTPQLTDAQQEQLKEIIGDLMAQGRPQSFIDDVIKKYIDMIGSNELVPSAEASESENQVELTLEQQLEANPNLKAFYDASPDQANVQLMVTDPNFTWDEESSSFRDERVISDESVAIDQSYWGDTSDGSLANVLAANGFTRDDIAKDENGQYTIGGNSEVIIPTDWKVKTRDARYNLMLAEERANINDDPALVAELNNVWEKEEGIRTSLQVMRVKDEKGQSEEVEASIEVDQAWLKVEKNSDKTRDDYDLRNDGVYYRTWDNNKKSWKWTKVGTRYEDGSVRLTSQAYKDHELAIEAFGLELNKNKLIEKREGREKEVRKKLGAKNMPKFSFGDLDKVKYSDTEKVLDAGARTFGLTPDQELDAGDLLKKYGRFGFKFEIEGTDLKITADNGEEYVIKLRRDWKKFPGEYVDAIDKWMRDHAVDLGSTVKAHLETTMVTDEQKEDIHVDSVDTFDGLVKAIGGITDRGGRNRSSEFQTVAEAFEFAENRGPLANVNTALMTAQEKKNVIDPRDQAFGMDDWFGNDGGASASLKHAKAAAQEVAKDRFLDNYVKANGEKLTQREKRNFFTDKSILSEEERVKAQNKINNELWKEVRFDDEDLRNKAISMYDMQGEDAAIRLNMADSIEALSNNVFEKVDIQKELKGEAKQEQKRLTKVQANLIAESNVVSKQWRNNTDELQLASAQVESFNFDQKVKDIKARPLTTPEQVEQANKDLELVYNEYKGLVDNYNSLYRANKQFSKLAYDVNKRIEDTGGEIRNLSIYQEYVGDNYQIGTQMWVALSDAIIDMGQGVIGAVELLGDAAISLSSLPSYLIDLPDDADPTLHAALQWWRGGDEWGGFERSHFWVDDIQESVNNWQATRQEGIQQVAYDDIRDASDFGEYAAVMLTGQIPNLALMAATGGTASLWVMGSIAAGQKFNDMREQNQLYRETGGFYGTNHNLATMFAVSAGTGAAEGLSEKITLGQIKAMKATFGEIFEEVGFKAGVRKYVKEMVLSPNAIGAFGKDIIEEGVSESIATLSQNMIDSMAGQDVGMFDNVEESFVSGALMSSLLKIPTAAKHVRNIAASRKYYDLVETNHSEIRALEKQLLEENLSAADKKKKLERIAELTLEVTEQLEADVMKVAALTDPHKKRLFEIDKERSRLQKAFDGLSEAGGVRGTDEIEADKDIQAQKDALNARWIELQAEKSGILDQYDDAEVARLAEDEMRAAQAYVDAIDKADGDKIDLEDGNSDSFEEFQEKWMGSKEAKEQLETTRETLQKVLDDPRSSKKRKREAQKNLDLVNAAIEFREGDKFEYGAHVPVIVDGKLTHKIFINKETSIKDGMFTTAAHEFLHAAVYKTIQGDPAVGKALGDNLIRAIEADGGTFDRAEFNRRMSVYPPSKRGEETLTVLSEMLLAGKVQFNDSTWTKIGDFIRQVMARVTGRDIKFDEASDVKKFIKDYAASIKGGYADTRIVKMAVEGAKGKIVEDARGTLKEEFEAADKEFAITGNISDTFGDMSRQANFSRSSANYLKANAEQARQNKKRFDDLTQNEDGTKKWSNKADWDVSAEKWSAFSLLDNSNEFMDNLIMSAMTFGEGYIKSEQDKRDFIKAVKENLQDRLAGGMKKTALNKIERVKDAQQAGEITALEAAERIEAITNNPSNIRKGFDPTKANGSLFGWLTGGSGVVTDSIIYRARGDVMNEWKADLNRGVFSLDAPIGEQGETFGSRLTEGDTATGGDTTVEATPEVEGKKMVVDTVGIKPTTISTISNAVEVANVDVKNLTYKGVKKLLTGKNASLGLVLDSVAKEFGIPSKKILENKDLDSTQRKAAQQKVLDFAEQLHESLPDGQTASGKATGLPKALLNTLYTKVRDRVVAAEGRGTQGKPEYEKNDFSRAEFLAAFGINEDGTFNNNKKFDGALRAIATQTATLAANQAIRQQAIDKAVDPMKVISLVGDGKSGAMFSRRARGKAKKQVLQATLGKIDNSIKGPNAAVDRAIFWEGMNDILTKGEAILNNNPASIERFIREKFSENPEILKRAKSLAKALHSAMIPMLERSAVKGVKSIEKKANRLKELLYAQNLNSDLKVAAYSKDTVGVKHRFQHPDFVENRDRFRAADKSYLQEQWNPDDIDGFFKRLEMLKQSSTTSPKRAQAYTDPNGKHVKLFTDILVVGSIDKKTGVVTSSVDPDLKFKLKKDGGVDTKTVTYKGEKVEVDTAFVANTSKAALNDSKDPAKKAKRKADEKFAVDFFLERAAHIAKLYNNGDITNVEVGMFIASELSNMNASLRRAAGVKYISEDAFDILAAGGKLKYEHMIPAVVVAINVVDTMINGGGIKAARKVFNQYTVQIIGQDFDNAITAAGNADSLPEGTTLDTPNVNLIRSYARPGDPRVKRILDLDTNTWVDISEVHSEYVKIMETNNNTFEEIERINIGNKMQTAGNFSRRGPAKSASVLDFDDTLATTKSKILFTKPDGTKGSLNAEQYARDYVELAAQGYEFDFSEFNKVVEGAPGPYMDRAKKLASRYGTSNMYVLTARAPQAQEAIFEFLKAQGLNIPAENIVGLGNSTGQAKADWIAEKLVAEGFNDIEFADDALQNVKAVQEMFDVFDVKGSVLQAKANFSRRGPARAEQIIEEGGVDLDSDFNFIVQEKMGVGKFKEFSPSKARQRGKNKGRFKFFIPPSADDFAGLCYSFFGKGEQGERHHAWFKKHLFDPFSKGVRHLNQVSQVIANDFKKLKKASPNVAKQLTSKVAGTEYTLQDAIRVRNWIKAGFDVPGLSQTDANALVKAVEGDVEITAFADAAAAIGSKAMGPMQPSDNWMAGTMTSDFNDLLEEARSTYLNQWIENKNIVFSEKNLNKIEAVYGSNFREALEDMLWRMEHGGTRNKGKDRLLSNWMTWLHGSIGATMFFNARSAILQQLSNINFINWHDNNPLKAAAAFANQKQYWSDVVMIFNSPWLKQRRGGLQTDVNAKELLEAMKGSKNPMKTATAYLLQLGFTPTQIGDSIAIATGGATMYRNRVSTYLEQGMTQAEAESKAFEDMQEIAEETQQSTREDKISQQQASPLGKMILAFQNTPMQYNRLMKKAAMDLVNGRGDAKTHISKIIYYGAVQNMIFYGLQQALFAAMFDDDEEEDSFDEKKKNKLVNSMMDTVLRGAGIAGAVVSTVKNTIIKFMEESEKMDDDKFYTDPNWANVIIEALNISPPIGIKARKLHSSLKTWEYNDEVIERMDKTDIDNPMWESIANVTEATTNLPTHRLYNKVMNIREAMDADNESWQRIAMLLGWSRWSFGIQNQDVIDAKNEVSEIKAQEAEERREQKKIERAVQKADEELQVIEDNKLDQDEERENGATEVQCAAVSRSGKRCSNMALPGEDFCTIHMPVPQQQNEVQCSHIKDNGDRCKMKTKNKSGKCYYHD